MLFVQLVKRKHSQTLAYAALFFPAPFTSQTGYRFFVFCFLFGYLCQQATKKLQEMFFTPLSASCHSERESDLYLGKTSLNNLSSSAYSNWLSCNTLLNIFLRILPGKNFNYWIVMIRGRDGTPFYKLYRYVSSQWVWFWAFLVWKWAWILAVSFENRYWKIPHFGLRWGQGLENWAGKPHQKFPGVLPGYYDN